MNLKVSGGKWNLFGVHETFRVYETHLGVQEIYVLHKKIP